jgi:hypothetical protein
MQSECGSLVDQIQAEMKSIGQLRPGRKPQPGGVVVFTDPLLPDGWVGLRDPDGRQAFGFAPQVLDAIKTYVRVVVDEEGSKAFQSKAFWAIFWGFPSGLLATAEQESLAGPKGFWWRFWKRIWRVGRDRDGTGSFENVARFLVL